ncbi:two-component system response regulator, partial [Methylobacterium radiotolerans]
MIVEDDHIIAGNLYSFLEARGFLPDVAYSGPAALQQLQTQRFDAVLLDIGLPGMDGNAVLH